MKALSKNYLRTQVETATAPQLLIMLFDGAVRFAEKGKVDLEAQSYEASYEALVRAQRIVVELTGALDREVLSDDLHANLSGLYGFIYRRLVEGNVNRSVEPVEEALKILRHVRETWLLAIEKMDPALRKDLAAKASGATEHRALSVHG